ncbi:hypothetical protein CAOG_02530 [Capsaspora owczarzaki ATCC 30864]|uniref:AD domain-containing protein n=1 Tax=Capsaspora owczarzaki (strain ATCC 30864) TaxID=595528 RepID=A0A0D2X1U0_CAPO3|nr:hypothetical protein CAOG_02530 [Capsaspora owczarzaki ATCC 30864]KJE91394.1 hypothetical protein CAOG_002530 [Capsaspora owczarzaki ATCC 30864]|eukprot:XP_004349280.1 hypothetical protein CAOG_02530 [Capsaspora owczarzaki ATCC 30864]
MSSALAVGTRVRLKTTYGDVLEGRVVVDDATSRTITLELAPRADSPWGKHSYRIVSRDALTEVAVTATNEQIQQQLAQQPEDSRGELGPWDPLGALSTLDSSKLKRRVEQETTKIVDATRSIGVGVTPQAQQLYYALAKTHRQIQWGEGDQRESIIVLDDVRIDKPYGSENCTLIHPSHGQQATLERIKKLVDEARKSWQS